MKNKIIAIFLILTLNAKFLYATDISSPSAVVINKETGRILYDKNSKEKRKMASLTKIMTALLLIENCKMDEVIEIDSRACNIGGSEAGLKPNDKITAKNLLYAMMLPSGNDAAMEIAYHIGGNIENFAAIMNKKALELGLCDTHFENPHGLDSDNHYTSAYSLAMLTRYALNYEEFRNVVSTKEMDVNLGSYTKHLNNTNALLRTYDKATGVKTGFTNGANRCLVTSAKDNDLELIAVVLGSETSKIRFDESKQILEETFSKYKVYDLSNFLNVYINIPVKKGNIEEYIYDFSDNFKEALTEDEYSKIYVSQDFLSEIDAPLKSGSYIGSYSLVLGNETLYRKEFYLPYDITKNTVKDYFVIMIKKMFNKMEKI